MFLLGSVGFNGGDILFQLIMFIMLLTIPGVIIAIFFIISKRNKRIDRMEEKLDQLLEKERGQ
ncbi:hypothetical protein LS684_01260 [Cytobacillus spongiae]|jgi:energy-converting hydrogenase Eha subunit H|uniref:hypothetical protein n=1 Tax=Cytobacillus spongiae TaxID=2901381 RepID=UPI001F2C8563|nr:hypothetical protein [Cytobacillus spongiae]UII56161.1 hypothetical protein LS684_01260 [Cytobacillus spongiae]